MLVTLIQKEVMQHILNRHTSLYNDHNICYTGRLRQVFDFAVDAGQRTTRWARPRYLRYI